MTAIKQKILDALSVEPTKTMIVGYRSPMKYTAQELAKIAETTLTSVYAQIIALKKDGHDIRTAKHTRETYQSTGNVEYYIEPENNDKWLKPAEVNDAGIYLFETTGGDFVSRKHEITEKDGELGVYLEATRKFIVLKNFRKDCHLKLIERKT